MLRLCGTLGERLDPIVRPVLDIQPSECCAQEFVAEADVTVSVSVSVSVLRLKLFVNLLFIL